MTSIVFEGEIPTQVPTTEDGGTFPFGAVVGDTIIFAESRTEIISAIYSGYAEAVGEEISDNEALIARYTMAVEIANTHQQVICAQKTDEGLFSVGTETEETLTALFSSRNQSLGELGSWNHIIPLVLVSTDYAPFTTTPAVEGNILWINPYTETTFLTSLHKLGLIELMLNDTIDD